MLLDAYVLVAVSTANRSNDASDSDTNIGTFVYTKVSETSD